MALFLSLPVWLARSSSQTPQLFAAPHCWVQILYANYIGRAMYSIAGGVHKLMPMKIVLLKAH